MNNKSKCCNAPVKVVGGIPDFIGDKERSCTLHYECESCGKPCDIQEYYISKTLEEFDKNALFKSKMFEPFREPTKQFIIKALENQKKEIKKEFVYWFNNDTREDVEDAIERILK